MEKRKLIKLVWFLLGFGWFLILACLSNGKMDDAALAFPIGILNFPISFVYMVLFVAVSNLLGVVSPAQWLYDNNLGWLGDFVTIVIPFMFFGYLQWFVILPRIVRWMRNRRG